MVSAIATSTPVDDIADVTSRPVDHLIGTVAGYAASQHPLQRLAHLAELRRILDQVVAHEVAVARKGVKGSTPYWWRGIPWSQIGAALGLSAQGAQQRYGRDS